MRRAPTGALYRVPWVMLFAIEEKAPRQAGVARDNRSLTPTLSPQGRGSRLAARGTSTFQDSAWLPLPCGEKAGVKGRFLRWRLEERWLLSLQPRYGSLCSLPAKANPCPDRR